MSDLNEGVPLFVGEELGSDPLLKRYCSQFEKKIKLPNFYFRICTRPKLSFNLTRLIFIRQGQILYKMGHLSFYFISSCSGFCIESIKFIVKVYMFIKVSCHLQLSIDFPLISKK